MQDTIKNTLTNFMNSFLSKRGEERVAVGIDIGSSSIKLVELSLVNNKIKLNTYGSIALGSYGGKAVGENVSLSSQDTAKALSLLLKECDIKTKQSAFSLPISSSFFKQIYIPDTITQEEMRTVVETEARRVIPIAFNDVSVDWLELPKEIRKPKTVPDDKKELMLVALSKESLKHAEDVAKESLLDAKFFEIESFSIARSTYAHERSPILMVDLGSFKTKIAIVHEGVLSSVSHIDYAGFQLTQYLMTHTGFSFKDAQNLKHASSLFGSKKEEIALHEQIMTYIIKPIIDTINEYERISSSAITRIVLSGGGSEMFEIVKLFEEKVGIPTELSQPFSRTILPDDISSTIETIAPEFTIATGLALRLLTSA